MAADLEVLAAARAARLANQHHLIDPDRLRARRVALGVSEHALASAAGVEPTVIRRLERGHLQNGLTVAFILTLPEVLGCALTDLLADAYRPDPSDADRADSATLGTILAHQGDTPLNIDRAAELLGWTLTRTLVALDALTDVLTAAGQSLAWVGPAEVLLAAPDDPTGVADTLADDMAGADGLNRLTARYLADVAGAKSAAALGKMGRNPAVGWLVKAGFITTTAEGAWYEASGFRLTDRARYDLCLDQPDTARPTTSGRKRRPGRTASAAAAGKSAPAE